VLTRFGQEKVASQLFKVNTDLVGLAPTSTLPAFKQKSSVGSE